MGQEIKTPVANPSANLVSDSDASNEGAMREQ